MSESGSTSAPPTSWRCKPLQQVRSARKRIALTCKDGEFGAISGVCNHVGGPLGEGTLDGDYVVCPWHYWKFHCRDRRRASPASRRTACRATTCEVENGRVLVDRDAAHEARRASRTRRIRWRATPRARAGADPRRSASRPRR